MLLALGDRDAAARLTAGALADAAGQVDSLRHPERGAAWLRARVVARAGRGRRSPEGAAALEPLGARHWVVDALGALDSRERAAVIARMIEGFDLRDVGTVVGREGAALERLVGRGMRRYVAAVSAIDPAERERGGPVRDRLAEAARRVVG